MTSRTLRYTLLSLILVVLPSVLAGCGGGASGPSELVIGVYGSLTGSDADFGQYAVVVLRVLLQRAARPTQMRAVGNEGLGTADQFPLRRRLDRHIARAAALGAPAHMQVMRRR
jgi:hypothetical protein